jgi:hypothetical protein
MKLPNKSLEFLRDVLAAPGWVKSDNASKKVRAVYEAGKLLSEVLPEPTGAPVAEPNETVAAFKARSAPWDSEESTPEFTLTTKQEEVCKQAVTYFVEEDKIPKGRYANILIDLFKVLD